MVESAREEEEEEEYECASPVSFGSFPSDFNDEEETMGEDDTEETWKEKVAFKEKVLNDKARLKAKFNLSEDKQGRYRQVLHTRRPKDIQKSTKRLVTSFKVFDRDE